MCVIGVCVGGVVWKWVRLHTWSWVMGMEKCALGTGWAMHGMRGGIYSRVHSKVTIPVGP